MSTLAPPPPVEAFVARPYASRLAVLPFENLDGDSDGDRLARGFRQDIITELARFPALGVLAAQSSTTAPPHPEAPSPDRPSYVVTGSIRRSGATIRVAAQLLEAASGHQMWSERYDRPGDELFAIQDEITARVANALHARIDQQNLAAARRRPVTALAAYEAWLRGYDLLHEGTLAADAEARTLFARALEIDPQFARGYAGLSLSYFNEWSCNAWDRWAETERKSFDYARRAEALDPNDQAVQIILGRIQQYRRRFNEAEHHFQRALALAPNDAEALIHLSTYFAMQGQPELGITLAERSLDLNPLCPYRLYPYAAIPYFVARRYREALELGQKAPVTVMVDLPGYYAAAAGYLEDRALASTMIVEFDRQFRERIMNGREPEPEEQLLWVRHVNPFRRPEDLEHLVDGIERARKFVSPLPAKLGPTETASGPAPTPRLLHWPIANTFRVEGSLWTIAYEGHVVHLPELKGYRDIAYLLARPDDEVHCLALAGRDDRTSGAADEVLDRRARRAYQSRIQELRAELAEAADANDPGRTRRAQEELDALVQEVARATGIGGRSRKLGDPAERARTAVTWRIRKAVKTLSQLHAALGKHLSNSLQTGVFCRYSPEKPVDWEV